MVMLTNCDFPICGKCYQFFPKNTKEGDKQMFNGPSWVYKYLGYLSNRLATVGVLTPRIDIRPKSVIDHNIELTKPTFRMPFSKKAIER